MRAGSFFQRLPKTVQDSSAEARAGMTAETEAVLCAQNSVIMLRSIWQSGMIQARVYQALS